VAVSHHPVRCCKVRCWARLFPPPWNDRKRPEGTTAYCLESPSGRLKCMSDAAVIHRVLHRAHEGWGRLDRDDLTAAEEQVVEELSRQGLIELRQSGRISLVDDPRPFVFRVQYAGNGGRREAVYALLKALTDLGHEGTAFTLMIYGDAPYRASGIDGLDTAEGSVLHGAVTDAAFTTAATLDEALPAFVPILGENLRTDEHAQAFLRDAGVPDPALWSAFGLGIGSDDLAEPIGRDRLRSWGLWSRGRHPNTLARRGILLPTVDPRQLTVPTPRCCCAIPRWWVCASPLPVCRGW
jgi:hypothetical protein